MANWANNWLVWQLNRFLSMQQSIYIAPFLDKAQRHFHYDHFEWDIHRFLCVSKECYRVGCCNPAYDCVTFQRIRPTTDNVNPRYQYLEVCAQWIDTSQFLNQHIKSSLAVITVLQAVLNKCLINRPLNI